MNSGLVSPDQWHSISIQEEIDEKTPAGIVEICTHAMPIRRSDCSSLRLIEFMSKTIRKGRHADLVSHVVADQLAPLVILANTKPARPDDKAKFRRFIEETRQLEVDEAGELFEKAFSVVASSTPRVDLPRQKGRGMTHKTNA